MERRATACKATSRLISAASRRLYAGSLPSSPATPPPAALRVTVPDIDSYQRLIDRLLGQPIGIERYFSYVVTKSVPLGRTGD